MLKLFYGTIRPYRILYSLVVVFSLILCIILIIFYYPNVSVGLIEFQRLGGTCVNVGCVPKKVMYNTAVHSEYIRDHADYGFDVTFNGFNWSKIQESRDAYVRRLNGIYETNLKNSGVELIRGRAAFADDGTVEVNGRKYAGKHILVAVGGTPSLPADVPGADYGTNSDGFSSSKICLKKVW